jgi:hypothetical protein
MPIDMSSSRPAALRRGPTKKPRSVERAAGDRDQRRDPGHAACGADARQPGAHQHAVVVVERHYVGHRSECDQVEQLGRDRRRVPKPAAERQRHVERDADAGQRAAAETRAGQVGVDDRRGRRQRRTRQMMIGDQHVDSPLPRGGDALEARDAVVDGDDERRRALSRERHDLRRESVAEAEAVRHQVADRGVPEPAERPHQQRTRGRAVGVVVANDEDSRAARHVRRKERRRVVDAVERADRQQPLEPELEVGRGADAARGVDPPHDRIDRLGEAHVTHDLPPRDRPGVHAASSHHGRGRTHTRQRWWRCSRNAWPA